MKLWEAMRALEEGKKIRCSCWKPHRWVHRKGFDDGIPLYGMDFQYCLDKDLEWELYEEPQSTLSFAEVVQGLKEGKKFMRIRMQYVIYSNRKKDNTIFVEKTEEPWRCMLEDFEATDWIEVK